MRVNFAINGLEVSDLWCVYMWARPTRCILLVLLTCILHEARSWKCKVC